MSALVLVAVSLTGLAVFLAMRPPAVALEAGNPLRPQPRMWLVAAVTVGAVLPWVVTSQAVVLGIIGLGVATGVVRILRRGRRQREADHRADLVLSVCEAMAADLAAGQPPLAALRRSARDWPELAPAAVAADMGADVPAALRGLAVLPGAAPLRALAASWQVAHRTGSGLADAVARAAAGIRAERRTARLVAAELASARATARMLAVLPGGVLLIGAGIGGDPVGFLTQNPLGLGCLALGLALSFAGLSWLDRIADQVLGR